MPLQVHGYAAIEKGTKLKPLTFELPDVAPNHVRIKVTHCGLCHSDVHLMENDLGISRYPMVPGHEVVGVVEAVGGDVTAFEVGQRVGVGWLSDSCGSCKQCQKQHENLCAKGEALIASSKGGFATHVDVHDKFAYAIPEALTSENAAPLLCAGITVYAPLKRYIKDKDMTVAVVGIGGLGHLGLQFAKAMGVKVIAISHSDDKKEEALKLGADVFVNSTSITDMKSIAGDVDLILDTVSANHNFKHYFNLLAPNGTLCLLGITNEELKLYPAELILSQKQITGSAVGSPKAMLEMLNFAAEHNIKTWTEEMPMSQVNEAIEKLLANKVRYRIVLTQ